MEYLEYADTQEQASLSRYTAKTYLWMFAGLVTTFLVALLFSSTGMIFDLIEAFPFAILVIAGVELLVVIVLTSRVKKLSVGAAFFMFFLYAALNGLMFSTIFLAYEVNSAIVVFAGAALVFGIMGLWGYYTQTDLLRWGRVLLFGLIGLIFVGVLGFFIDMSALERVICLVGVAIFMAYTAYDTQKIKAYYYSLQGDALMLKKASIISALALYLDFINLFLYLLRLFGRRR